MIIGANGQASFSGGVITSVSTLKYAGGNDTLVGGPGNEVLIGGGASVTITAGSANNIVIGHNGNVTFTSGSPTTAASTDVGNAGSATITTGAGYDLVMAGTGNNTINGGSGTSLIAGTDSSASSRRGRSPRLPQARRAEVASEPARSLAAPGPTSSSPGQAAIPSRVRE